VKAKRTQTFPKEERRFLYDSHATMGYIHIPICIRTTLCIVCAFKERRINEGLKGGLRRRVAHLAAIMASCSYLLSSPPVASL